MMNALNHSKTLTEPLHLTAYKRLVRHLKGVSVKNLSYRSSDASKLSTFFTLHDRHEEIEFYQSEVLTGTINPTWESFDLTNIDPIYTAANEVILRVWVKDGESELVHLEYIIHLQLLQTKQPNADESPSRTRDFITFSIFNTTFQLPEEGTPTIDQFATHPMDPSITKASYSLNLLARLQTVLRALKQTQQSVNRVRQNIQEHLVDIKDTTEKQQDIELAQTRIVELRNRLKLTEQAASLKKTQLYARKAETRKMEKEITTFNKVMMSEDERLAVLKSDRNDKKGKLLRSTTLLFRREKQLIHELCVIFPIEQTEAGRYLISGIPLPGSDFYSGCSDESLATPLGYCCHLVHMLSCILCIPLQYPLICKGSKSRVRDFIVENDTQKDKGFPLYGRSKEKTLFRYATFLLNKDIAQLRYAFGMPTQDLRLTLRNLSDFLTVKMGVVSPVRMNSRIASSAPSLLRSESTNSTLGNVAHSASFIDSKDSEDSSGSETQHPVKPANQDVDNKQISNHTANSILLSNQDSSDSNEINKHSAIHDKQSDQLSNQNGAIISANGTTGTDSEDNKLVDGDKSSSDVEPAIGSGHQTVTEPTNCTENDVESKPGGDMF